MSGQPLEKTDYRIEDLPEQAWPRQEIIDGKLYVTPYAKLDHQGIVGSLFLALYAAAPKNMLVLPGANVLRRGATDRLLIPDVVVLERDSESVRTGALAATPEDVYLAAEVISPSTARVWPAAEWELLARAGRPDHRVARTAEGAMRCRYRLVGAGDTAESPRG